MYKYLGKIMARPFMPRLPIAATWHITGDKVTGITRTMKCKMLVIPRRAVLWNKQITSSFSKFLSPTYSLRPCPATQAWWSAATIEHRQSVTDGVTLGGASPQSSIKYTSESYAISATWLSLVLTHAS